MIRLITVAFALVVSTSAQATPLAPLQQPDGMITQVREACGAGMGAGNATVFTALCSCAGHDCDDRNSKYGLVDWPQQLATEWLVAVTGDYFLTAKS